MSNINNIYDIIHMFSRGLSQNMRFGVLLSRERARIGLAAVEGATMRMRRQLGTTDTESGGMS
jgi:hypothetical protein